MSPCWAICGSSHAPGVEAFLRVGREASHDVRRGSPPACGEARRKRTQLSERSTTMTTVVA